MKVDPAQAPTSGRAGVRTLHLSVPGGLRQFGAYVEELDPGAWSSQRHWHDSEDEFLFVLEGQVTLRDDDGMQDLGPGDAVTWRHGATNAHHLTNRSQAPCRYLIMGSRVRGDRCRYPDTGEMQVNLDRTWQLLGADGQVLREGDLPEELLDLPAVWGEPGPGPFQGVHRAKGRVFTPAEDPPHRILGGGNGPYSYALLSDPGGISQFGAFIEKLPPGSRSGFRHWHEAEDEMVLMLEGEVVLVEDSETPLFPGDLACWPAGHPVGHCLENRSTSEASYLVIGTRLTRDVIHYPDHDLIAHKDGAAREWFHADGRKRVV